MGLSIAGGGKTGSIEAIQKSAERASGEGVWIVNIPNIKNKAGGLRVRFLEEPDTWYKYQEHWDDAAKDFCCVGAEQCKGCASPIEKVRKKSVRYIVNALDVENGRVIPLKVPVSLINKIVTRYQRYDNTITDRDYYVWKAGTGTDTEYDMETGEPQALDLSQYAQSLHDAEKMLLDRYVEAWSLEADLNEDKAAEQPPF